MSRRAAIVVLLCACQLDTSGTGAPSNMLGTLGSSGSGDEQLDSDGSASTTTAAPGDGPVDDSDDGSTAADPTDHANETSTGEDTAGGTTDAVDPCIDPAPFAMQIAADQAVLAVPMTLDTVANGTPYVYSPTTDAGTATFTFVVPCPDEYYFHGFVYDAQAGPIDLAFQDNGADSYAVEVEGVSATWHYGCQTGGLLPPLWQWQPLMNNLGCIVNDDKVVSPLVAGMHTLELRNLEAGTNAADTPGTAAAIAVLSVTNDPSYSP